MTDPAVFRCQLCGQRVTNVTDGEGTSHYEGVAEREVERLREFYEAWRGLDDGLSNFDLHAETVERFRAALDAVRSASPARVNEEDGA